MGRVKCCVIACYTVTNYCRKQTLQIYKEYANMWSSPYNRFRKIAMMWEFCELLEEGYCDTQLANRIHRVNLEMLRYR